MILTVELIERIPDSTFFPDIGYAYIIHDQDQGKDVLLVRCPRCGNAAFTSKHILTIDEGKPTLQPSFGCSQCKFHSWLRNGVHEQLADFK